MRMGRLIPGAPQHFLARSHPVCLLRDLGKLQLLDDGRAVLIDFARLVHDARLQPHSLETDAFGAVLFPSGVPRFWNQSGLICTLRHLMTPPGAPLAPLPNWSANGPDACLSFRMFAVTTPLSLTVNSEPLAEIS
jgi:hypothetical protein